MSSSSPGTFGLLQLRFFKSHLGAFQPSPHARKSFAAQQLALADSLSHWNRLCTRCLCALGRSHPKGTRPAQQAAAPARCLGHTCDQTRLLRAARRPELLLNSAEASRHRKVPTLHLRHGEMRFSSGGSRCYRHRRHPRRLLWLLPCARGSCCWRNIPHALLRGSWAKPGSFP